METQLTKVLQAAGILEDEKDIVAVVMTPPNTIHNNSNNNEDNIGYHNDSINIKVENLVTNDCGVVVTNGNVDNDNDSNNNDSNNNKVNIAVVHTTKIQLIQKMEEWLGLKNNHDFSKISMTTHNTMSAAAAAATTTTTTVEDCLPLSDEFYSSFAMLIQMGWSSMNNNNISSISNIISTNNASSSNSYINSNSNSDNGRTTNTSATGDNLSIPVDQATTSSSSSSTTTTITITTISLEQCFDSVLITKWLRHFMEFSLDTDIDDNDNDNGADEDEDEDEDDEHDENFDTNSNNNRHGFRMYRNQNGSLSRILLSRLPTKQTTAADTSNHVCNDEHNNVSVLKTKEKATATATVTATIDSIVTESSTTNDNTKHDEGNVYPTDSQHDDIEEEENDDDNADDEVKDHFTYVASPVVTGTESVTIEDKPIPMDTSLETHQHQYHPQWRQQQQQHPLPILLFKALFNHIEQLSIIQSQIYAYVAHVQKPKYRSESSPSSFTSLPSSSNNNSTTHASTKPPTVGPITGSSSIQPLITSWDTAQRLKDYNVANQISVKLQAEYQQHLERLEYILTEWYTVGSVRQRKYIRVLLGQYWNRFVISQRSMGFVHNSHPHQASSAIGGGVGSLSSSSSSSSSSSLRRENTSAAGVKMTLVVLYKILLGISKAAKEEVEKNETTTTAMNTRFAEIGNTNNWNSTSGDSNVTSTTAAPNATATTTTTSCRWEVLEHLLFHQLLPLHKVDGLVLWRDQMAMLELYHEILTKSIALIIQLRPFQYIPATIQALLQTSIFPMAGNTPKQVLLLHEIDTYLSILPIQEDENEEDYDNTKNDILQSMMKSLVVVLGRCMSSDNSRVAERALQYVKNDKFLALVRRYPTLAYQTLLPALVRTEPSWNPTVRKMTYNVLKVFSELETGRTSTDKMEAKSTPTKFQLICNELYTDVSFIEDNVQQARHETLPTEPKKGILSSNTSSDDVDTVEAIDGKHLHPATEASQFSLKAGMGSWRPPSNATTSNRRAIGSMPPPTVRQPKPIPSSANPPGRGSAPWAASSAPSGNPAPPLTVTGVAPWASSTSRNQQQPPLAITGVAPWATKQQIQPPTRKINLANVHRVDTTTGSSEEQQHQPPLTITGVAPWSKLPPTSNLPPTGSKRLRQQHLPQLETLSDEDNDLVQEEDDENIDSINDGTDDSKSFQMEDTLESSHTGFQYVLNNMAKLKPPDEEGGLSSWSRAQMAEIPTYLPDLKFHDLVFGHDLGSGAFGSVKYARLIDKTKSRSHWAEYAVKIVSTEKIRTMGYEASIQREIATLLVLSHHPGIARLVSSFRFREGAYLVLEYGSQGDLHSLLQKHGSLDNDSTRFVIGEVIAALCSIHDMGFLYGDLKPENIVITETGHLKLTDFGGCRPITDDAKERISSLGKGLLKNLRDGDWKTQLKSSKTGIEPSDEGQLEKSTDDFQEYYDDDEEDHRIEGTTAYLPPEVVMGSIPTLAADSWALGCVMYQCMSGRPPLLDIDEYSTKKRIVTFDIGKSMDDTENYGDSLDQHIFQGKNASGINKEARSMICSLLNRDSSKRPGMHQIAEHEFFTKENVNVFLLFSKPAYPLDVGDVAPTKDNSQWSRRQFSSIWAPQPVSYDISNTVPSNNRHRPGMITATAPILEGGERCGYFSLSTIESSGNGPTNVTFEKKRMLLPPSFK